MYIVNSPYFFQRKYNSLRRILISNWGYNGRVVLENPLIWPQNSCGNPMPGLRSLKGFLGDDHIQEFFRSKGTSLGGVRRRKSTVMSYQLPFGRIMAFHIWSYLIWFITLHLWDQSPFDWKHSTFLTDATPLRFLNQLKQDWTTVLPRYIYAIGSLTEEQPLSLWCLMVGFSEAKINHDIKSPPLGQGAACEGRQSTFRRVETRMSHISDNLFVLKIFNTTVCAVQTTTWKEAFNQRHPKTRYNKNSANTLASHFSLSSLSSLQTSF